MHINRHNCERYQNVMQESISNGEFSNLDHMLETMNVEDNAIL